MISENKKVVLFDIIDDMSLIERIELAKSLLSKADCLIEETIESLEIEIHNLKKLHQDVLSYAKHSSLHTEGNISEIRRDSDSLP